MDFKYGTGIKGPLTKGLIEGWERTRNGGSYAKGRDFLWAHWEVHDHEPTSIKLHVESPAAAVDEELNGLKCRIITALLKRLDEIQARVPLASARVEPGKRLSVESQRRNKSTEAFRVVVSNVGSLAPHEEKLVDVDRWAGPIVREVLSEFQQELDEAFPDGPSGG